jgi:hypothetical protein
MESNNIWSAKDKLIYKWVLKIEVEVDRGCKPVKLTFH